MRLSAFEGAVAFGCTVAEACDNAATVLRLFVAQWLDEGRPLPESTFHDPPMLIVSVDIDEAYRVRTRCATITEAAKELGVSTSRVSQLATSGALDAVELDGRRYVTWKSIGEWETNRRGAGRPRREAVTA